MIELLCFFLGMLAQFYLAKAFSQPCDMRQFLTTQEALIKANALLIKSNAALLRIARWHGEFPTKEYGWDYGSNGERDFMRQVALDALRVAPAAHAPRSTDSPTKGE